ncbi:hypothetical protein JKP88DRAFT_207240 [Tribonema minus]|uniref:Dynamin N-terminal domain-containing protein n=1 Tax=Tribonema minus TaxID=303371 RepID=A0A836CHQ6_9STRA|nr:hypothetical protein JKP88DRAFT_207240 [Tribonema minus]
MIAQGVPSLRINPRVLSTRDSAATLDTSLQAEIMSKCEDLSSKFIQPLNDRLRGPLDKSSSGGYRTTKLPFVFVLGNHSSGKSSFINHCIGRTIQTTGVAPTDDSFTIIAPGPKDIDQDGPALIGDPDMGFSGLRQFGPALIHHTCLKVRRDIATSTFMMVDSPGMIDSPVTRASAFDSGGGAHNRSLSDRGYDFEAVVKWFADRADVILLFFDPDKPGTTGETLSILTNSLPGLDHKLYIVLNKADKFERIHDFARAFGSLCWNLSKVIQRKDLPRIYTMCLPEADRQQQPAAQQQYAAAGGAGGDAGESSRLGSGLQDLESTRVTVLSEVFKAPKRRIDNIITRLTDSVHLLQVHATIVEDLQRDYRRAKWGQRGTTLAVVGAGAGAAGASMYLSAPLELPAAVGVLTVLLAGGVHFMTSRTLRQKEEHMLSVEGLNMRFSKCYATELAEGDEMINSVWKRIRESLKLTLGTSGLNAIPSVKANDLKQLQRILDQDIPSLRRSAAPVQFTYEGAKAASEKPTGERLRDRVHSSPNLNL